MKATISYTFSDVGLDAPCDFCNEPLPGASQLWQIDDDDSYGWFCSRSCAEKALEREETNA